MATTTTIHSAAEAQSLPTKMNMNCLAFYNPSGSFDVKSEQLNAKLCWLFNVNLVASQVNFKVEWIYLCGVSIETARIITKQLFPNLVGVSIPDNYKLDYDPLIEQALQNKNLDIVKFRWDKYQKEAVNPEVCGTSSADQQAILAFVNKCIEGWRPQSQILCTCQQQNFVVGSQGMSNETAMAKMEAMQNKIDYLQLKNDVLLLFVNNQNGIDPASQEKMREKLKALK